MIDEYYINIFGKKLYIKNIKMSLKIMRRLVMMENLLKRIYTMK